MKDIKNINCKSLTLDVEDIDTKTRKVVGYLSTFGVIDSDRDMMIKGCYSNSIKEKGAHTSSNRKIAYLYQHDITQPIGKFTELQENEYGLRFVAQLSRNQKGEDCFLDYQDGILREHSVGFFYKEDGIKDVYDSKLGNYYEITDVDLFEGSAVTLGSNSFTFVSEVNKSEDVKDNLKELNDEMFKYMDILRNGAGSDDRFKNIELGLEILKSKYVELFDKSLKISLKHDKRINENDKEVNENGKEFNKVEFFKHFLKN